MNVECRRTKYISKPVPTLKNHIVLFYVKPSLFLTIVLNDSLSFTFAYFYFSKFKNIQKYVALFKFGIFHSGNTILSNIKQQANHSSFKSDKYHDSLGTFHHVQQGVVASVAFKVSKTKAQILALKHQAK